MVELVPKGADPKGALPFALLPKGEAPKGALPIGLVPKGEVPKGVLFVSLPTRKQHSQQGQTAKGWLEASDSGIYSL